MWAWGKAVGAYGSMGVAYCYVDCSQSGGQTMDGKAFGMATRGQRYSMSVNDGVGEHLNVEAPGEFKVSSADHMLEQLWATEKPLLFRGGAPSRSGVGVKCCIRLRPPQPTSLSSSP